MKKVVALVLGVGALLPLQEASAILLKANNNEFANVSLKLTILAQNNGALTTNDHNSTNFSVQKAGLYFAGQVNPLVQFQTVFDFEDGSTLNPDGSARAHTTTKSSIVRQALLNFKFKPEFQVVTGLFSDPWSRIDLEYLYSFVVPLVKYNSVTGEISHGLNLLNTKNLQFITPTYAFTLGSDMKNAYRDAGIGLWGDIGKDNMLKYYIVAGNGKYDYEAGQNGDSNLKYGFRIEFTPTFLGYKGEGSYLDEDTYLGNRNTLTFGFAYQQQKIECGTKATTGQTNYCPAGLSSANSSTTAKAYTFDVLWEQKFGDFVPNFQAAWLDQKDLGYTKVGNSVAQPEAQEYYLQTQFLYDKYVGIGKPAIALRYEDYTDKNYYSIGNNFIDGKIQAYDVFFNYYITGLNASVSLGAQAVNPLGGLKAYSIANNTQHNQLKSFVDYTLALRTVF